MPLLGQASGGWTESSSALRLLHAGVRNTVGILTADSFTQTNPPGVVAVATITTRVDQTASGVLSGSVAFARPDGGSNQIGGPGLAATQVAVQLTANKYGYRALGVFVNSANGNAFENQPGVASGKGPYMSGQGTYGNALYETAVIVTIAAVAAGVALTYTTGYPLMASRNGYLMPLLQIVGAAIVNMDALNGGGNDSNSAERFMRGIAGGGFGADPNQPGATVIGLLKMPPDATPTELVYDQRV